MERKESMPKSLVWLVSSVGVVAAIAFGVVVYQALLGGDTQVVQTPDPSGPFVATSDDPAEAPPSLPPAPVAPEAKQQRPSGDVEIFAQDDPVRDAETLSPGDNAMKNKAAYEFRLPSSLMAQRLNGAADPTLRFTPEQAEAVRAIEEEAQREIAKNLVPIWKTCELLQTQMKAFRSQGNMKAYNNARGQYNGEYAKGVAFKIELNKVYTARLKEVLTEDQMKYFSGVLTPEMQARLYGTTLEDTDAAVAGAAPTANEALTSGRDSHAP